MGAAKRVATSQFREKRVSIDVINTNSHVIIFSITNLLIINNTSRALATPASALEVELQELYSKAPLNGGLLKTFLILTIISLLSP